MAEEFRVLRPYEFHCQLINKGKRADGRTLTEFRNIKLETDAITTANSSSLVKLGNTSLVCGCTTRLLKRTARNLEAKDDEIQIKIELPPICSSPTGHRTQHTEQLLTKTLRNILDDTKCLDRFGLSIEDDNCNWHWSVEVEVICLNYDGCLLDAALIAVLAALGSLKLHDEQDEIPDRAFKLNSTPICSSFALIGDRFICDPNLEEEAVAESTFSVTVDPSDKGDRFHLNKTGGKAINISRLSACIQKAKERAAFVQKYLKEHGMNDQHVTMDCA